MLTVSSCDVTQQPSGRVVWGAGMVSVQDESPLVTPTCVWL